MFSILYQFYHRLKTFWKLSSNQGSALNNCSFMSGSEYETMQNSNCTWICPKCDFFNFSDSFFNEQFNLESENRFDLLAKGHETKSTETLTSKNSYISGLKFSSININSIRGKKLELLAFIDFHQSKILAIQETKIDNSILTSELFPESFPYSVYRKDRTLNGGGVMLLVHKDIPHMPLTELDNDSESVWVKLFVNQNQNQNQNSLLVKRQTDNTTPGGMGLDRRGLVPSSHKRSKFRHTII